MLPRHWAGDNFILSGYTAPVFNADHVSRSKSTNTATSQSAS